MIGRIACAVAALTLPAASLAAQRYGDTLLAQARRAAGGAPLRIDTAGKDGTAITVGPKL